MSTRTVVLLLASLMTPGCGGRSPDSATPPAAATGPSACVQECLEKRKPDPAVEHATRCICFALCDEIEPARAAGCVK
ncbi:MAG: hypothetical protein HYV09_40235 [Deltaproteobacteria bacterium]|nr:hypothetical protein [Deltaproteobacteria bacterium]